MVLHHALDQLDPGGLPPHRHLGAYATIVRRGRYVEAAFEGRLFIHPGTIIIHPSLHLHSNIIIEQGTVWNIALNDNQFGGWRALRGSAVERMVAGEHCPTEADLWEVLDGVEQVAFEPLPSWLADLSALDGGHFAEAQREVSREHAHRTFSRHFGMPPGRYRRERQLQKAAALIASGVALADAAAGAGFSDQSHMTRIFTRELGITPSRFRSKITLVQDCVGGAS